MNKERSKGFTMIELMITVAIISILAGLAISNYSTPVEAQINHDSQMVFYDMLRARYFAARQKADVIFCLKTDVKGDITGYTLVLDNDNNHQVSDRCPSTADLEADPTACNGYDIYLYGDAVHEFFYKNDDIRITIPGKGAGADNSAFPIDYQGVYDHDFTTLRDFASGDAECPGGHLFFKPNGRVTKSNALGSEALSVLVLEVTRGNFKSRKAITINGYTGTPKVWKHINSDTANWVSASTN